MNDMPVSEEPPSLPFRPLAEFIVCARFLTRLPIPFSRTIDPPPLHRSLRMLPLAGALIGAFTGALFIGGVTVGLPGVLAALIACAVQLLITGALHEDGLADVADGFAGGKDRESRLAIMRDSRIGSYGTLALVLLIAMRVFALVELGEASLPVVIGLCAAAAGFSRSMTVDLMWSTKAARADGLSRMVGRPSRNVTLFAILSGILITAVAAYAFHLEAGLIALAAATLSTAAMRWTAIRMIGGQTGDVCGAAQSLSEIAMLIAFASMVH